MSFVIKHYKTAHIEKLRIHMYTVKNFLSNLKKDNKFRKVCILHVVNTKIWPFDVLIASFDPVVKSF